MSRFVIFTDATSDMNAELQKKYDIEVLPTHVVLPGGKEIPSFLEWKEFDRDTFYADLKKNPTEYTTSPANVEEFKAAFEKYASRGRDVLALTISSGISGSFGFMLQAQRAVSAAYPNVTIRCIDSMRFGPGYGLMAIHASLMRDEGKSLEETAAWIEANKNRFHQAGWLDDLSFVAKKGRITHAKAFFGSLAGVKPLGEFDYNGLTTVIGKAKGAKQAYAALIEYMKATIENPEDQVILLAQTSRYPQAVEYKRLIEENFHPKAIYINDVFPSCGINIGPGLMAAYYVGKPISADLSEEKTLMENCLNGGR